MYTTHLTGAFRETSADICGTSLRRTDLPYRNERRDRASWPKQGHGQPPRTDPPEPVQDLVAVLDQQPAVAGDREQRKNGPEQEFVRRAD